MAFKALPPSEVLRQLLRYEAGTGKLFWRTRPALFFRDAGHSAEHSCNRWNATYAGKEAFTEVSAKGYRRGVILGEGYAAHRIIWSIAYGSPPAGEIDHINGNKTDNRLENLRDVTRLENSRNARLSRSNKSGCPGVSWDKRERRWVARIRIGEKRLGLGYFLTLEEAIARRKLADAEFGFHQNHGR